MLLTGRTNLDELLETIQVPDAKYESANTTFQSLCDWFRRDDSTLTPHRPESYLQGSFRLGTAIRPLTDDDDYDLDIVCCLALTKQRQSQADLKAMVGAEVQSYSTRHSMKRPREGRRCWTQVYADGSQFHVDTLPALPDADRQRTLLEDRGLDASWVETAIGITDKTDANYHVITQRWPLSNPRGYARWFESRLGVPLQRRKEAIALAEHRRVEDIPTYRARVPLQSAVQLLKFHRNAMFVEDNENKPISAIITTLAALAYRGESDLSAAMSTILRDMHTFIETRLGVAWVPNPTNNLENFADKWSEYPHRRDNFYRWLETARLDFRRITIAAGSDMRSVLTETFGDEVAARFRAPLIPRVVSATKRALVLRASHRQAAPWTLSTAGSARIFRAVKRQHGFRPMSFSNDGSPISRRAEIIFHGTTDVPMPYEVYWQVVNTGTEAHQANDLRGGFSAGSVYSGSMEHKETAKYRGVHSIQMFIVKQGYLAAQSEPFIVNID